MTKAPWWKANEDADNFFGRHPKFSAIFAIVYFGPAIVLGVVKFWL